MELLRRMKGENKGEKMNDGIHLSGPSIQFSRTSLMQHPL